MWLLYTIQYFHKFQFPYQSILFVTQAEFQKVLVNFSIFLGSYFELGDDHMDTFRDQFVVYSNFLIAPFHFHSHHNSSYNRCNLSLHNHICCNSNIVSMFQKTTATSIKDHVEGPFWMQQRIICNLMGNSKTFEKYFDCTSF